MVLEAQFPETAATQPELLAHHCTEASLIEQAVLYWHQAGQQHPAERTGPRAGAALHCSPLGLDTPRKPGGGRTARGNVGGTACGKLEGTRGVAIMPTAGTGLQTIVDRLGGQPAGANKRT